VHSRWFSPATSTRSRGVAVLIDENADVGVAEAGQVVAQQVGLLASELEQQRTAAPEEPATVRQDAPEDPRAVGAASYDSGDSNVKVSRCSSDSSPVGT